MAGWRPKLTAETENLILGALALGLSYKDAAAIAGVDETTLHRWRKIGREGRRPPYRQFHQRVEAANARKAQEYLEAVDRSILEPVETTKTVKRGDGTVEETTTVSPPDIKGALWWLERRLPALFGRRLEHAGSTDSTRDRENQRPLELLIVDPVTPEVARKAAAAYDLEAEGEELGRPEHADTAAAAGR